MLISFCANSHVADNKRGRFLFRGKGARPLVLFGCDLVDDRGRAEVESALDLQLVCIDSAQYGWYTRKNFWAVNGETTPLHGEVKHKCEKDGIWHVIVPVNKSLAVPSVRG